MCIRDSGVRAGYAKFETFPVWNLPLKHPVNIAYEAATDVYKRQLLYSWMTMRQQRDQMVGQQAEQMKMMQWMMYLMPLMLSLIHI